MAGEEMINLTRLGDFHADMTVDAHILKRSTAYAVDKIVNKGFVYLKCTQAGTTASTALSLSGVSVGDELTDGSAKWEVISVNGVPEGGGTGAGLEDWESNHNYAVDDIYVYEGEIYKTLVKFTSGATEDERTEINNIVPSAWIANTAYTAGDIIEHTDVTTLKKVYYNVTDDFTSGATFEVTAEMQELQVVEEYVPNPLTSIQEQEIINHFMPNIYSGGNMSIEDSTPIGTIISFMGTIAPENYLVCDGETYNITDYIELAEFIKTQFGSYNYFGGDGTTTFAVPDLRGEFLRGTGANSHTNQGSGASVGTHQDGTIQSYDVIKSGLTTISIRGDDRTLDQYGSYAPKNRDTDRTTNGIGISLNGTAETITSPAVATMTTRPTNTSVLYCIKYQMSITNAEEIKDLTTEDIKQIVNSYNPVFEEAKGIEYSTEERRIGTWIDGKPLYQKTIVTTCPNASTQYRIISVPYMDKCFVESAFGINPADDSIFNFRPATAGIGIKADVWFTNTNHQDGARVILQAFADDFTDYDVYITLKYTKTTD